MIILAVEELDHFVDLHHFVGDYLSDVCMVLTLVLHGLLWCLIVRFHEMAIKAP